MGKGENVPDSTLAAGRLFCYNVLMAFNRFNEPKQAEEFAQTKSGSVLMPAIARLGVPVGVFGLSFFVITVLLTLLLSPDRFPVRVGDKTVRLYDLETEEKSLKAKQADLLEERQKILADSEAPVLHQVEKLRSSILPVGSAMLSIEDVRRSFRAGTSDPISFPGVMFDATANTLTLVGEVRDAGGRSMQILASLVDELRVIAAFESVSEPEYVSELLAGGGTVSRFSITLRFFHE